MKNGSQLASAAPLAVLSGALASAAEKTAADPKALDEAFAALKTFDWGTGITIPAPGKPPQDSGVLAPIRSAVVAAHGDAAARKALETRLIAVLKSDAPRAAKDFVCRELKVIGTAECVPALAALLADKDLSHMARFVLQAMCAPEAAAAMREALPKLQGPQKVGTIGSLGVRRDAASVSALVPLLNDADKAVASAAVTALGMIGTPEAADALRESVQKLPDSAKAAAADACLACAESLLAAGKKPEAIALYKSLSGEGMPKHVRLAATRGLLSAAGKKD